MLNDYVTLGENGRVVIPAGVRAELKLKKGDRLCLSVEGGELRFTTAEARIAKVQAMVRRYIKSETKKGKRVLLSDELIAERRAEAARE